MISSAVGSNSCKTSPRLLSFGSVLYARNPRLRIARKRSRQVSTVSGLVLSKQRAVSPVSSRITSCPMVCLPPVKGRHRRPAQGVSSCLVLVVPLVVLLVTSFLLELAQAQLGGFDHLRVAPRVLSGRDEVLDEDPTRDLLPFPVHRA